MERPDRLWIGHRSRPNESLASDASLLSPEAAAIARLPGGHVEGFENAFAAMYRAIYSDIAAGGPSPSPVYATFDDGHEEMLVGDPEEPPLDPSARTRDILSRRGWATR